MKMKWKVFVAALLLTTSVNAADAPKPPVYAPVTLSATDMQQITSYLNTLPYGQAAPIMDFLARKEATAQKEQGK